jgi:hypothetical protein
MIFNQRPPKDLARRSGFSSHWKKKLQTRSKVRFLGWKFRQILSVRSDGIVESVLGRCGDGGDITPKRCTETPTLVHDLEGEPAPQHVVVHPSAHMRPDHFVELGNCINQPSVSP